MLEDCAYNDHGKSLPIRAVAVPFCGTILRVELPPHRNSSARWECGACGQAEAFGVGSWSMETVVTHAKCLAWRHACRAHPEAVGPLFPWGQDWNLPE